MPKTQEPRASAILSAILSTASDPVLLVNGRFEVLWCNRAAALWLKSGAASAPKLTQLLSEQKSREILRQNSCIMSEATVTLPGGLNLEQTVIACDVSSGEPDSLVSLVLFKSRPPDASAIREQLLVNVAHDLKNPLGAIFGYADALLDSPGKETLTPKQREVISRVRATASRCIDLVRNYQQLCELQTRGITSAKTVSNLNAVVRAVIEYTWREEKNSPALLVNLSQEDLPVRIERVQLDRIVSNLFSNALRYTPAGEQIIVNTAKEGEQVVFRITNTGVCIAPDELPLLFQRYRRGRSAGDTAGSGLGLYIVKQLVDGAGGTIEARSSCKETTFCVKLPAGYPFRG